MFNVYFREPGKSQWEHAMIAELDPSKAFDSALLRATPGAMGMVANEPHIQQLLAAEVADPLLARGAIETWSKLAQDESAANDWLRAPKLVAHDEALACYPDDDFQPSTGGKPVVVAWHDSGGVFVHVPRQCVEVRVEYDPPRVSRDRAARLRHRYATADHDHETILDWRSYSGVHTAVHDGYTRMRRRGNGYVTSFVFTGTFLVANVLHRFVAPGKSSRMADPSAESRRHRMETDLPAVADQCPDLSAVQGAQHERAMVFVHGTMSCGLQGLKDMVAPWALASPGLTQFDRAYRFEHDTFQRVSDNASELAKLIQDRLAAKKLLIAGHSRGGLVAKLAADLLRRDHPYPGEISVYTFGTPHLGTPLVTMGEFAVHMLMKLGETISDTVPIPALPYLVRGIVATLKIDKLPAGISAMDDKGELVLAWQALPMPKPAQALAFASTFDVDGGPSGFGIAESFLLGSFGDRPNDLVVPTDSALAFGTAQPVLGCSHSHYFRERAVLDAIQGFFKA